VELPIFSISRRMAGRSKLFAMYNIARAGFQLPQSAPGRHLLRPFLIAAAAVGG